MTRIVKLALPSGSSRRKLVKKILLYLHVKKDLPYGYYNTWVYQKSEKLQLVPTDKIINSGPLISIVVPAFNTPERYLYELVYSIVSQSYQNWELVLVNASTKTSSINLINNVSDIDTRIKVLETVNNGIAENTNTGIINANGEYIAFVDHDDVLEPNALSEVAMAINREDAELIYSDEDKISDNSDVYFDLHLKPDWSPDLLTHVNYINHLTVIKKKLIDKAGLLDPQKDGAQDYDLLLRVTDLNPKIYHIPRVLYHWRAVAGSTAYEFASKTNITQAGREALNQHFYRVGLKKDEFNVVPLPNKPGFYNVNIKPIQDVAVIFTPFASDSLIGIFVEMFIQRTNFNNKLTIVIPSTTKIKDSPKGLKIIYVDNRQNYLAAALTKVSQEIVTVINQIAIPEFNDWLNYMSGSFRLPHIACVSPLILRDNIIDDAGLAKGSVGNLSVPIYRGLSYGNQSIFGNTDWVRDVNSLSGGIVLTRKDALQSFIGKKQHHYNLVDSLRKYSLSFPRQGKYNVICGNITFNNHHIHLEPLMSKTKKYFNPNIYISGKDYELYTPEEAAINILMGVNEQAEK